MTPLQTVGTAFVKVHITSVGIRNIWILLRRIVIYILSAENFVFIDIFVVKIAVIKCFHEDRLPL